MADTAIATPLTPSIGFAVAAAPGSGPAIDRDEAGFSRDDQSQVKGLFRNWEDRVREQVDSFSKATVAGLKADADISDYSRRLRDLRVEQAELRARQETSEHAVKLVCDQQEALGKLLGGLEKVLGLSSMTRAGQRDAGSGCSKVDLRAGSLKTQLDELDWQVRELNKETRSFQAFRCGEPLQTVAHVLNAHSSELDAIQVRVDAAERVLRDLNIS